MGRRENLNYSVAPRYTAGSPGLVDPATGQTVAAEEKRAYQRALEGMYGPEDQERAKAAGLEGIVYIVTEKGGNMHIRDVITEQFFKVPTKLWGAGAPDGQNRWHSRTDREQFRVNPETLKTRYETYGKRYVPAAPQAVAR